ncbi:unnamed protein product [Dicrocoelium dendriticum]|nr:unnamed protein product [Dicrocoelium dendriticum]
MPMGYFRRHLVVFEDCSGLKKRHVNITFEPDHDAIRKNLVVRLSDEEDLYFLYSLSISDEDFNCIKAQQGLLVDFEGFSQKVVDLLDLCFKQENSANPKYLLKFLCFPSKDHTGVFQIVEATNFKHLVHLSLTLIAGDSETLKSYLVGQLKTLKNESRARISCLERSLAEATASLSLLEEKLILTSSDFDGYKSESLNKESNLRRSYEEKLASAEEKLADSESRHRILLESERELAAKACEKIRSELGAKLDALKHEVHELERVRDQLQTRLKQLSTDMQSVESQNSCLKEELKDIRSKLLAAESVNQSQSATVNRLEARLNQLERELSTKDQLITKVQDLLSSEQEQKSRLQDELQAQTRCAEKLKHSVERESEEVKKANEIIKHLQTEVKNHHTKAKLRGQVAAEQERLLSSKDVELQERTSEVAQLRAELKDAKDNITKLTEQVNQTTLELTEAQKTIKTNENIIGWLNRQVSEKQLDQAQQRLRSTGFPTPINAVYSSRPFSTPNSTAAAAVNGMAIAPPWQPATSLYQPSCTIISKVANAPAYATCNLLSSTSSAINSIQPSVRTSSATLSGSSQLPIAPTPTISGWNGLDFVGKKTLDRSNNMETTVGRSTDVRSNCSPAPVTKSTPLHSDPMTSVACRTTASYTTRSAIPASGSRNTKVSDYRPSTYVPSASLAKQRQSNLATSSSLPSRPIASGYPSEAVHSDSNPGQEETDPTLFQQSLTSAYFPKTIGSSIPK